MERTSLSRLTAAVVIAACAFALTGCGSLQQLLGGPAAPERDPDTNEVTEAGEVDVFALQEGDCLHLSDATEINTAAVVPCADPHTDEIYHVFELPDGDWPGDDAVTAQADEGCLAAFEEFVGLPYDQSVLVFTHLRPLEEGWNDPSVKDRLVQCIIYEPVDEAGTAAELTGSLAGAQR